LIAVVYHLTAFPADKWLIENIDKLRRGFLWSAEEETSERKCLVNWAHVCSPKRLGGLSVKIFNFLKGLYTAWLSWDDQNRP
jgi:hypothetical protein